MSRLLAMVYHRRDESELTKSLFAEAMVANDRWIDGMAAQSSPFPWFDGLESHILLSEANLVISPERPLDDTHLEQLESRALSVIER